MREVARDCVSAYESANARVFALGGVSARLHAFVPYVRTSVGQSVRLSVCHSALHSVGPSVHKSIDKSARSSVRPSPRPPIRSFVVRRL